MADKKVVFCWKKWLKKLGINTAIIIAAGVASVYGENPLYLALVPTIHALINYIKHG